ncbi:MAG: AMP-binding protein [Planctomycetota bacterium]
MNHAFQWLTRNLEGDARTRLSFVENGGGFTPVRWTGDDWINRAFVIGALLAEQTEPGERVLLAYPPGLEFAAGFLGCVHAGLIPVPVPPPKPGRIDSRYAVIAKDCNAKLVLSSQSIVQSMSDVKSADISLTWVSTTDAKSTATKDLSPRDSGRDDDLLFLQYTSGSTSAPKGVMVTLENLNANLEIIGAGFQIDRLPLDERIVCGWLPMYHDMGLIGILMAALVHNGHAVLISPQRFVQTPSLWLQAMSDHRARMTIAPTFGYHWAAQRISETELRGLDLSSIRVAGCGAEPIDPAVLDAFADRFAEQGWNRNVFYPCYGLAESTLMVTGHDRVSDDEIRPPRRLSACVGGVATGDAVKIPADKPETTDPPIASNTTVDLVSSGQTFGETRVEIVHPQTHHVLPPEHVGEIWTSSSSVAAGYFGNSEATQETFQAKPVSSSIDKPRETPTYLRTGDLGFIHEGELFVTGRIKDLIIIGGANHYPQDIEHSVTTSVGTQLGGLPAAAIGVNDHATESLAVLQEVPRHFKREDAHEIVKQIRLAVASEHDLAVDSVVLVRMASLPRTSSGKLRRFECRDQWLDAKLKEVHRWNQPTGYDPEIFKDIPRAIIDRSHSDISPALVRFIEGSILDYLKQNLSDDVAVRGDTPFASLGLDSLRSVEMARQLELWLGIRLSPVVAWSYPDPQQLAMHLAELIIENNANTSENHSSGDGNSEAASNLSMEQYLEMIESMSDEEAEELLKRLES